MGGTTITKATWPGDEDTVAAAHEHRLCRANRTLARVLLVASVLTLVYSTTHAIDLLAYGALTTAACMASVLFLGHLRIDSSARLVLALYMLLGLTVLSSVFESEARLHMGFFSLAAWTLGLFPTRVWLGTGLSALAMLGYAAVEKGLLPPMLAPQAYALSAPTRVGITALNYLLLIWVLWRVYRDNQKTEALLNHAVSELEHQAQERKDAQRSAEASRDAAERAECAKGQFLAVMSHELRTPINGMVGGIDLFADGEDEPERRKLIRIARGACNALLTLVSNVLDFAALDPALGGQGVVLRPRPFDLWSHLEKVTLNFVPQLGERPIDLTLDIATDVPRCIVGDEDRLGQLLGNLLANAAKYTERGHILLRVQTVNAKADHGRARELHIELIDSRSPFTPYRPPAALYSAESHHGEEQAHDVGLDISHAIAQAMGGVLNRTPRVGGGHAFALTCRAPVSPALSPLPLNVEPELRCAVLVSDQRVASALRNALLRLGCCLGDPRADGELDCVFVDGPRPTRLPNDVQAALSGRCHTLPKVVISVVNRPGMHSFAQLQGSLRSPFSLESLANLMTCKLAEQRQSPHEAEEAAPRITPSELPSLDGLRVLVAEDNAINQKIVLSMLRKMGIEAEVFANGRLALTALREGAWHLVLMDIQMPEMDGIEATAAIRAEEKLRGCAPVPIIALSANVHPADIEAGMAAGLSAYLSKPVGLQQLHRTIAAYAVRTEPGTARWRLAFESG